MRNSLRLAFVVYAFAVALNLIGGMWLYTLNGINRVRESSQLNIVVLAENYLIAIAGLLSGLRLWALVIANLAMGRKRACCRPIFISTNTRRSKKRRPTCTCFAFCGRTPGEPELCQLRRTWDSRQTR